MASNRPGFFKHQMGRLIGTRLQWVGLPFVGALFMGGVTIFLTPPPPLLITVLLGILALLFVIEGIFRWTHKGDQRLWRAIQEELPFTRQQHSCYATTHNSWGEYAQTRPVLDWEIYRLQIEEGVVYNALPIPHGDPGINQDSWAELLEVEDVWYRNEWITTRPLAEYWQEVVHEESPLVSAPKLPSV